MNDVYRFHVDIDMDDAGFEDGRGLADILQGVADQCRYGIPNHLNISIPDSNDNPVGRCWIGN